MKNKIITIILSAILLISLSACNDDIGVFLSGQESVSNPDSQNEVDKETEKDEENNEDEKITQTVKVYFSDNQAMNLIETQADVTLTKDESLEEKIIESLKSQPKDPEMFNAIDENIKVNSVNVEERTAEVDLSSENLSGSSTQETFLIDSIVSSLTSLDNIDSVKFLVDGKEVETLMGHMETIQEFTKDDITNNIIKPEK